MDGTADDKQNRYEIEQLLFWQAVGCGVLAVITLIFWKQGYSRGSIFKLEQKKDLEAWERQGLTNKALKRQLTNRKIHGLTVGSQIKELLKRKYLLVVIFNYGLGFGIVVACGALLTEIVHSVGYSTVRISSQPFFNIFLDLWTTWKHLCNFLRNDQFYPIWVFHPQEKIAVRRNDCSPSHDVSLKNSNFLRTIAQWFQLAVFEYSLPAYLILINMSIVGFFVFPIVSITLEELVMRTNPSYLVTVQVMCTISCQGIAALLAYGASFMFNKPTRESGLQF